MTGDRDGEERPSVSAPTLRVVETNGVIPIPGTERILAAGLGGTAITRLLRLRRNNSMMTVTTAIASNRPMTPRMISLLFDDVSCDFVEVVVELVSVVEVVLNCMFCTGILRTELVSVGKAMH